jgi:hypothetical protein
MTLPSLRLSFDRDGALERLRNTVLDAMNQSDLDTDDQAAAVLDALLLWSEQFDPGEQLTFAEDFGRQLVSGCDQRELDSWP